MKTLVSNELLSSIPNLYQTEHLQDPICHIKLFTPDSNWSWFIIEHSKTDNKTCYGYVIGFENELGYFNLEELQGLRGNLGLPVEIDTAFKPTPLSVVIQK